MKNQILLYAAAFFLVFTACEDKGLEPAMQDELSKKGGQKVLNFRAHLSGDEEVPPADTRATGQALFKLSKDGTELQYKLIASNIENIRMAHIHVAPRGQNGGVVVWLYPDSPPPMLIEGRHSGILAQGIITKDNLTGALAGQELSALIALMLEGQTYVNVHTDQYPGGEIRGQIKGNADPL